MIAKKSFLLSIELEMNDDGYLASIPDVQGAFAEGDSVEEAVFNCVDVVKMIAAYRAERGESLGFQEVDINQNTRLTVLFPVGLNE